MTRASASSKELKESQHNENTTWSHGIGNMGALDHGGCRSFRLILAYLSSSPRDTAGHQMLHVKMRLFNQVSFLKKLVYGLPK